MVAEEKGIVRYFFLKQAQPGYDDIIPVVVAVLGELRLVEERLVQVSLRRESFHRQEMMLRWDWECFGWERPLLLEMERLAELR